MNSQANTSAARFFLLTWACYLLGKAGWTSGSAEANCNQNFGGDDAQYSALCSGYIAAATFYALAALLSCFTAATASHVRWRISVFNLSGAIYALGLTCENGGLSSSITAQGLDDRVSIDEENYFSGATVFFFFAFIPGVCACVYSTRAKTWQALICFNTYLFLLSLGWLTLSGGKAVTSLDSLSNSDQSAYYNLNMAQYRGFGFAAFCSGMAAATALLFAFVTYNNRESMYRVWMSWYVWATFLFLGFMSSFATQAAVYCTYSTIAHHKYLCDGFVSGTFFSSLTVVASVFGFVFALKGADSWKHMMLLVSFGLWNLAYGSTLAGEWKFYCANSISNDDYYKDQCKGYQVGAFFNFVGFVLGFIGAFFARFQTVPHSRIDEVPEL